MNKPKLLDKKMKINHPTFPSGERLVNLDRGRKYFVGLSILLVTII